jgi:hypothetical protein
MDDWVSVGVNEEYGLVLYQNRCHTHYEEPPATRVVQDAAKLEPKAVQYAHDIAKKGEAFKSYYGEYVIDFSPAGKYLAVVRPNDLLTCKAFQAMKRSLDGALVWRFAFKMAHPNVTSFQDGSSFMLMPTPESFGVGLLEV